MSLAPKDVPIASITSVDDLSTAPVLPDSRLKNREKGAINRGDHFEVPIFCAFCGSGPAGYVPEENMTYAFYLCDPCFASHGHLTNLTFMPDQVFFEEVRRSQVAKYGRTLTNEETVAALADPESHESLLVRSREALTPKPSF